jgi:tetratricopeptide (TPR) repeat protein
MSRLIISLILFLITTPIYAQWQVAILPFENRTDDPQQEWIARGISESVVVALYKVPQIHLVDETLFGDTWQNAVGNAALMDQKNVHVVIQGWYQMSENQLNVHTDIVEASNGKIRKTIVTETTTQHPQEAVSEIALNLVENLAVPLEPVQKTAIQKPISANFENYRTTINSIRVFRQATHQTPTNATLLAQAETGFKRAISEQAQNAHATYYLGRIYELRENMSEAETTYRKALALDFEHIMARYHLALLFKKQGRTSEALSELEQTLHQSPLNPDIQTTLSGLFFSQYEQTFQSLTVPLEDMIKAAPDDPTGYYELGNAYDELYRYTKAATYFEQAIERDSTLADAHFKLGLIYHRKGLHEKAVNHLERAAQYGTQFNRVHFRLGEILFLLNRYDDATNQFAKAIEKEPNYLIPRYHLGMSQLAQHQTENAFKTFQKYAELTVDDPRPYIQMGNIHQQKSEPEKAFLMYKRALEISATETEAHYQIGYLYADQKKYTEAVKHLKMVLRLQPDHLDAINMQQDIKTFSK